MSLLGLYAYAEDNLVVRIAVVWCILSNPCYSPLFNQEKSFSFRTNKVEVAHLFRNFLYIPINCQESASKEICFVV